MEIINKNTKIGEDLNKFSRGGFNKEVAKLKIQQLIKNAEFLILRSTFSPKTGYPHPFLYDLALQWTTNIESFLEDLVREGYIKNNSCGKGKKLTGNVFDGDYPNIDIAEKDVDNVIEFLNELEVQIDKNEDKQIAEVAGTIKATAKDEKGYPYPITKWKLLTIRWTKGNQDVEIINSDNHKKEITNYRAMGFHEKRGAGPNVLWKLLMEISSNNGRYLIDVTNIDIKKQFKEKKRIYKQFQLLSKALMEYFGFNEDPFLNGFDLKESGAYQCKINLIPQGEIQRKVEDFSHMTEEKREKEYDKSKLTEDEKRVERVKYYKKAYHADSDYNLDENGSVQDGRKRMKWD